LIQLVGKGTLGQTANATDYVNASLINVATATSSTTATGRYGWWVGDESQKARVIGDSYIGDTTLSLAQKIARSQAPATMGTKRISGLETISDEDDAKLTNLPSLLTLDVMTSVTGQPSESFHSLTPFSYNVLSDFREGGLKRDLSTLLERPISTSENGDQFMLYKFSTKDTWMTSTNQECVPLSDLAAYHQMYDSSRTGEKEGLRYASTVLPAGMQAQAPDYGQTNGSDPKFSRQYTAMYRSPVPIKLQFLLSLFAEPLPNPATTPNAATHILRVGITPSMTLWNPLNVPMTMNFDKNTPIRFAQLMRMGTLPLTVKIRKSNGYETNDMSMTYFAYGSQTDAKAHIFNLFFSGVRPIRFEPGEVKTFSLPHSGATNNIKAAGAGHVGSYNKEFFFKTDKYYEGHEVVEGWNPSSFMLYNRSATSGGLPGNTTTTAGSGSNFAMIFHPSDQISLEIKAETAVSGDFYVRAPFFFRMAPANHSSYAAYGGTSNWQLITYAFNSRNNCTDQFSKEMITKGFPKNVYPITIPARSGAGIIQRSPSGEGWPFMQFSLQAGVETNETANGGIACGRKFASRPFTHSSALAVPFLDNHTGDALYNAGWNWSISEINDVFEAPVQVTAKNQGYYGGGYTPENGTPTLVQQEIPVVPPMSIAALSHARLGGYSIANQTDPRPNTFQVTAITGQAGLFPHTLQAIGNSYAHPLLRPEVAYNSSYPRNFDGTDRNVTLADHSYLANKALWDEYFFSSISPEPSAAKVFENSGRAAANVAQDFFFKDQPLPNRRVKAYKDNLTETKLTELYNNQANTFIEGLGDKIAAHLMVEGAFNVNSTSVEAWKVFLSSLKGKPVAFLDKNSAMNGKDPTIASSHTGTPVGQGNLNNGNLYRGSPTQPSEPNQWQSWRELTDQEIDQLAIAMVNQVRLRGPFLSLSEFVNRRLDSSNPQLAVKGALQAALDDADVSINAGFRSNNRQFSSAESASIGAAFPLAATGPIAYGSAPYVDQADILRNLAEQISPRGDTFVIRTYGDAVDASGKVLARAWCEAVVQRLPEYLDAKDEPHIKQASLTSPTNRVFGRKLKLVNFRWLNPSDV
jgi:hypothetical protein